MTISQMRKHSFRKLSVIYIQEVEQLGFETTLFYPKSYFIFLSLKPSLFKDRCACSCYNN